MAISMGQVGSAVKKVGGAVKEGGKALSGDSTGTDIGRKVGEFGGKYMRRKPKPKNGDKPVFKYSGKTMSA